MFHDGVAVPELHRRGGRRVAAIRASSARKLIKPKHCKKGQFTVEIDVLSTTNGRWRT